MINHIFTANTSDGNNDYNKANSNDDVSTATTNNDNN